MLKPEDLTLKIGTIDTFVIAGELGLQSLVAMVRDSWGRGLPVVIEGCSKVIFEPTPKQTTDCPVCKVGGVHNP